MTCENADILEQALRLIDMAPDDAAGCLQVEPHHRLALAASLGVPHAVVQKLADPRTWQKTLSDGELIAIRDEVTKGLTSEVIATRHRLPLKLIAYIAYRTYAVKTRRKAQKQQAQQDVPA
jgi:hypothetical protein